MQPFKALLIEGTSGAGKSTLIDALLRRHIESRTPRKIRSLTHLAQSHTYGPLVAAEDDGTLTVAQNLAHLDRIITHLEWLHSSVQEHDRPWSFAVIDTLHLTHCARPGVVGWQDLTTIDSRLASLGCKLVFLAASADALWSRGILPRRNEQFILDYARKFGATLEAIHEYFVREQQALRDLFEQSAMPKLLLDANSPIESLVEKSYAFWVSDSPAENEPHDNLNPA
jgi:hypothetical protein